MIFTPFSHTGGGFVDGSPAAEGAGGILALTRQELSNSIRFMNVEDIRSFGKAYHECCCSFSGSIASHKTGQCLEAGGAPKSQNVQQQAPPFPTTDHLLSIYIILHHFTSFYHDARPAVMTAWVCWRIQSYEVSLRLLPASGSHCGQDSSQFKRNNKRRPTCSICQEGAGQSAPKS